MTNYIRTLIGFILLLVIPAAAQNTPINKGYLQSNLNGNQKQITNLQGIVFADGSIISNAAFASGSITNFGVAATGGAVTSTNVGGTVVTVDTTALVARNGGTATNLTVRSAYFSGADNPKLTLRVGDNFTLRNIFEVTNTSGEKRFWIDYNGDAGGNGGGLTNILRPGVNGLEAALTYLTNGISGAAFNPNLPTNYNGSFTGNGWALTNFAIDFRRTPPATVTVSNAAQLISAINTSNAPNTIYILPGTYSIGTNNLVPKAGVNVIGAGSSLVEIKGYADCWGVESFSQPSGGPQYNPGDNSIHQGFTITCDTNAMLAASPHSKMWSAFGMSAKNPPANRSFTNVLVRDVVGRGGWFDIFHFNPNSNRCEVRFVNCGGDMEGGAVWDFYSATGGNTNSVFDLDNCWAITRSSYPASIVSLVALFDPALIVANYGANVKAKNFRGWLLNGPITSWQQRLTNNVASVVIFNDPAEPQSYVGFDGGEIISEFPWDKDLLTNSLVLGNFVFNGTNRLSPGVLLAATNYTATSSGGGVVAKGNNIQVVTNGGLYSVSVSNVITTTNISIPLPTPQSPSYIFKFGRSIASASSFGLSVDDFVTPYDLFYWDGGTGFVFDPLSPILAGTVVSTGFTGNGSGLTNIARTGVTGLESALAYLTNNIGGGGGTGIATNGGSGVNNTFTNVTIRSAYFSGASNPKFTLRVGDNATFGNVFEITNNTGEKRFWIDYNGNAGGDGSGLTNLATSGLASRTGTGAVVLSNTPTIHSPTLTGTLLFNGAGSAIDMSAGPVLTDGNGSVGGTGAFLGNQYGSGVPTWSFNGVALTNLNTTNITLRGVTLAGSITNLGNTGWVGPINMTNATTGSFVVLTNGGITQQGAAGYNINTNGVLALGANAAAAKITLDGVNGGITNSGFLGAGGLDLTTNKSIWLNSTWRIFGGGGQNVVISNTLYGSGISCWNIDQYGVLRGNINGSPSIAPGSSGQSMITFTRWRTDAQGSSMIASDGGWRLTNATFAADSGILSKSITTTNGITFAAGSTVTNLVTVTSAMDIPSINAGASYSTNITVAGAKANDSVQLGLPDQGANAGLLWTAWPSNGVVWLRAWNAPAGAVDPASDTYRVTVTQF